MTIYALSSGSGVSGIAVIRITGKNTSSHELKGCGSFYAHLCLTQFLSDSDYETFLVDITKTIKNTNLSFQVRDICCNILILSLIISSPLIN